MPAKDAKPHTKPKRRWLWGPIIFITTYIVSSIVWDIAIVLLVGTNITFEAETRSTAILGLITASVVTYLWATRKGQKEVLNHCIVCGEEIHPNAPSQEVHAGLCNRTYLEKGQRSLEKGQLS
jgi:hypothetical protein